MPLRDHFRPPIDDVYSWDGLHAMWPAVIVQELMAILPPNYIALPGVYLCSLYEVDAGAFERTTSIETHDGGGTAVFAPPQPTLTVEAVVAGQDIYEVRVYQERRQRRLVAAVEIVSPSNKGGPKERAQFAHKAASLVRSGVCVSIVDIVSVFDFNLYAEVIAELDAYDPSIGDDPAPMSAATLHTRPADGKTLLEAWYYPLKVGDPLPTLPLRLATDLSVPLELERTYETCCRTLRIQ